MRHEGVVAVDHDPGPSGRPSAASSSTRSKIRPLPNITWLTKIKSWLARLAPRRESARRKCRTARRGIRSNDRCAGLLPSRELAPGAVELAVAGEHPDRPGLAKRQPIRRTSSSWVLGANTIASGMSGPELGRDLALGLGPDLVHHLVPLAVGKPGGVVPRFDLPVEARVGPEMMAVGSEMEPVRIGAEAAAEQPFEAQRSVLIAHSSGKTRFSSVARR